MSRKNLKKVGRCPRTTGGGEKGLSFVKKTGRKYSHKTRSDTDGTKQRGNGNSQSREKSSGNSLREVDRESFIGQGQKGRKQVAENITDEKWGGVGGERIRKKRRVCLQETPPTPKIPPSSTLISKPTNNSGGTKKKRAKRRLH